MKFLSIPFSWEPKLNYTFVSMLSIFAVISSMGKLPSLPLHKLYKSKRT